MKAFPVKATLFFHMTVLHKKGHYFPGYGTSCQNGYNWWLPTLVTRFSCKSLKKKVALRKCLLKGRLNGHHRYSASSIHWVKPMLFQPTTRYWAVQAARCIWVRISRQIQQTQKL